MRVVCLLLMSILHSTTLTMFSELGFFVRIELIKLYEMLLLLDEYMSPAILFYPIIITIFVVDSGKYSVTV